MRIGISDEGLVHFHMTEDCLRKTYQVMYDTYNAIFTRLGLEFRAVLADTGSIGGSSSHEFHVLASAGEDSIAFSDQSEYAANIEMAEAMVIGDKRPARNKPKQRLPPGFPVPSRKFAQLGVTADRVVNADRAWRNRRWQTHACRNSSARRQDAEHDQGREDRGVESPLRMATDAEIRDALG